MHHLNNLHKNILVSMSPWILGWLHSMYVVLHWLLFSSYWFYSERKKINTIKKKNPQEFDRCSVMFYWSLFFKNSKWNQGPSGCKSLNVRFKVWILLENSSVSTYYLLGKKYNINIYRHYIVTVKIETMPTNALYYTALPMLDYFAEPPSL